MTPLQDLDLTGRHKYQFSDSDVTVERKKYLGWVNTLVLLRNEWWIKIEIVRVGLERYLWSKKVNVNWNMKFYKY